MFNPQRVTFDVPGEDTKAGAPVDEQRLPVPKITPNTMLLVAVGLVVLGYVGLRYLLE